MIIIEKHQKYKIDVGSVKINCEIECEKLLFAIINKGIKKRKSDRGEKNFSNNIMKFLEVQQFDNLKTV